MELRSRVVRCGCDIDSLMEVWIAMAVILGDEIYEPGMGLEVV